MSPDHHRERFKPFQPGRPGLPLILQELLLEQVSEWPRLRDGMESLKTVRIREVPCAGFNLKLQFNPGRMISTAAKVDAQSIRERPCFLCVGNLPPEQRGIMYGDSFVLLCNPAPIFSGHYTISHVEHRPQLLENSLNVFLCLAQDLSPDFSVLYNGARCGASAPDHLHFQAGPAQAIPVETDAEDKSRRIKIREDGDVIMYRLGGYGRETLVLEGPSRDSLALSFRSFMNAMRAVSPGDAHEPMVNVIGSKVDSTFRLIVFPRSRHRPAAFFNEGDDRILVSPAVVDIGGLVITPAERDFHRLDARTLEGIMQEVSISEDTARKIFDLIVGPR